MCKPNPLSSCWNIYMLQESATKRELYEWNSLRKESSSGDKLGSVSSRMVYEQEFASLSNKVDSSASKLKRDDLSTLNWPVTTWILAILSKDYVSNEFSDIKSVSPSRSTLCNSTKKINKFLPWNAISVLIRKKDFMDWTKVLLVVIIPLSLWVYIRMQRWAESFKSLGWGNAACP